MLGMNGAPTSPSLSLASLLPDLLPRCCVDKKVDLYKRAGRPELRRDDLI
jgi:hypothetical protein